MQSKSTNIVVAMPNASLLEVSYYCNDKKLSAAEKKRHTELYIQLHDCLCIVKIDKSLCNKEDALETLVHNKVINSKGHLC